MPKRIGCSESVTEQNRGSSACRNKNQTREMGAGTKEVCI